MYSKFFKLKPEKQERIINASLEMFSKTDYKNVSTDDIVNKAGISKGALFHYFHNKKELYLFLYDYVTKILVDEYFSAIDLSEGDILLRLQQASLLKLSLLKRHPDMMNFAVKAYYEEDNEIKNSINKKKNEMVSKAYSIIWHDLDTSNFREDLDAKMVINAIFWTFEGYANREQVKLKNQSLDEALFEKWISEINQYIALFRKSFYKGGYES